MNKLYILILITITEFFTGCQTINSMNNTVMYGNSKTFIDNFGNNIKQEIQFRDTVFAVYIDHDGYFDPPKIVIGYKTSNQWRGTVGYEKNGKIHTNKIFGISPCYTDYLNNNIQNFAFLLENEKLTTGEIQGGYYLKLFCKINDEVYVNSFYSNGGICSELYSNEPTIFNFVSIINNENFLLYP